MLVKDLLSNDPTWFMYINEKLLDEISKYTAGLSSKDTKWKCSYEFIDADTEIFTIRFTYFDKKRIVIITYKNDTYSVCAYRTYKKKSGKVISEFNDYKNTDYNIIMSNIIQYYDSKERR